MNPIIILAGGFGTRLQGVLAGLPKPLAPIAGQPFLHRLIRNLCKQGADKIILSLHFEADQIVRSLARLKNEGIPAEILTVIEPQPLGTGGAAKFALKEACQKDKTWSCDTVFIWNGDTFLPEGLTGLVKESPSTRTWDARFTVVRVEDASRYGNVVFDPDGTVREFTEKKPDAGPGWINAGVTEIRTQCLSQFPKTVFSLEKDLFSLLLTKKTLLAKPVDSYFVDIGIPSDYKKVSGDDL